MIWYEYITIDALDRESKKHPRYKYDDTVIVKNGDKSDMIYLDLDDDTATGAYVVFNKKKAKDFLTKKNGNKKDNDSTNTPPNKNR